MTNRSFVRANDESRERLARLAAKLTPTDLGLDLGEGWTVASALAHTGFWDRWQAARWTEMLAGRWSAQDESVIAAEHLANDALHPYWAGVAASDVPALALQAATDLDALIAGAPDEVIDAIEGTPSAYLLHRHRHRDEHLDHIERSLAGAATAASGAPVDRAYAARNEASRAYLRTVLSGLAAADLTRSSDAGAWTVGQILGHLTFWDRFLAGRWRAALAAGPGGQPSHLPQELADLLNDGPPPTWGAFADAAGDAAIAETLAAAEEVDGIIAGLPESAPIETVLAERPALLDRSIHRLEHIGALQRILSGPNAATR
jgi:hypothetical protein